MQISAVYIGSCELKMYKAIGIELGYEKQKNAEVQICNIDYRIYFLTYITEISRAIFISTTVHKNRMENGKTNSKLKHAGNLYGKKVIL